MLVTLLVTRLRAHIGRSLALMAVIAVAAGLALAGLAIVRAIHDPAAPLQAATNGGDVEIDQAGRPPDPRALAALPEVQTVGPLIESGDTALQPGGQPGGEAIRVRLRRIPDRQTMTVDRPHVMTGRWFGSDREVVIEASLADTLGIDVGDQVTVGGERSRTVRVVGTAGTTIAPVYPASAAGSVFAGSRLYNAIHPVGTPRWTIGLRLHDPARADTVASRIGAGEHAPIGECSSPRCAMTAADIKAISNEGTDSFAQLMMFFAVLMLIAATMLIVTLLGSRLVSEARELTLLQVAGLTPGRLALLIAAEHAVLAVAGVAAGALLAAAVAPPIAESAATVFGSVSPALSAADVAGVGAAAVAVSMIVSGIGAWRAGRRSLAVIARGGSGPVHRSRLAALIMATTSRATLVLGAKDIATRRGRAISIVSSVALAVAIAVTVVGFGTSSLNLGTSSARGAALPADRADIPTLPVYSATAFKELIDNATTLVTTLQVMLGGVALVTLLAAASMSMRERLRELGTLHALGCSTSQLVGASATSHGALGMLGTAFGVPLGLGLYLLFTATGDGFGGVPPLPAVALVAAAAVFVCAASAAVPALLVQRIHTSQALAAE